MPLELLNLERCRKFNWRPLFIVMPDTPMFAFAWLWWTGSVRICPHTSAEAEVILAKMSGQPVEQCRGSFAHWDHLQRRRHVCR